MTNTSKNDKSWTCKEFLQVQTVIVMKDVEIWAEYLAESRNQSYIFLRVLQGFIKLFYPVRATCKPLEPSWVKKIATGTDLVLKVLETRWNRKNIEIFNTKIYGKILNDMHCQTELCEFEWWNGIWEPSVYATSKQICLSIGNDLATFSTSRIK